MASFEHSGYSYVSTKTSQSQKDCMEWVTSDKFSQLEVRTYEFRELFLHYSNM